MTCSSTNLLDYPDPHDGVQPAGMDVIHWRKTTMTSVVTNLPLLFPWPGPVFTEGPGLTLFPQGRGRGNFSDTGPYGSWRPASTAEAHACDP